MSKEGPARHFRDQLARNHRLVEQLSIPDFPYAVFSALQDWQRDRLRNSYADLDAVCDQLSVDPSLLEAARAAGAVP